MLIVLWNAVVLFIPWPNDNVAIRLGGPILANEDDGGFEHGWVVVTPLITNGLRGESKTNVGGVMFVHNILHVHVQASVRRVLLEHCLELL